MCVFFFLTGDNSYLSTVQIIDSLGPRRVQVDRGGSAGCAGLPEIYRDSSIPRGERGKYAIRVGRTVPAHMCKAQQLPACHLAVQLCIICVHLWHDSEGDMKISSYKMFFESELIFKPTKPSCHELFIIIVPRQCKLKFNSQENAQ